MNAPSPNALFNDWELPTPTVAPEKQAKTEVDRSILPVAPALAPINAADKRIVNGKGDINQLAPFKYPWAWEFFLKANRNHWTPSTRGPGSFS
ncbi:MAG: ribonucleoside-diphosphate reductase beta chain [Rhodocyclaceae bacterium]|nr:MAG: ribonucleoside-diphosphate reductase beta chain [Rhodocyclaceae bacterium]